MGVCLNFPVRTQRKEYVKYAKVFPLTAVLDVKIPSKWYRRVVGMLEVVCGLAMATIPSRKFAAFITISRFAVVCHLVLMCARLRWLRERRALMVVCFVCVCLSVERSSSRSRRFREMR